MSLIPKFLSPETQRHEGYFSVPYLSYFPPALLAPNSSFSIFSTASPQAISELKMRLTTSLLDPIPTALIKLTLPAVSPAICIIVNMSLGLGIVAVAFKITAVIPALIKLALMLKTSIILDQFPTCLSCLWCLSMLCPLSYLASSDLLELFQSSFRAQHSGETAMVRLTNDLLLAAYRFNQYASPVRS